MKHIHYANAMTVLKAQPFTAEEIALLEAAGAELPWEQLSPMIKGLQKPDTAAKAKDVTVGKLTLDHVAKFEKEITDAKIETSVVSPKLLPNYTNQKSI